MKPPTHPIASTAALALLAISALQPFSPSALSSPSAATQKKVLFTREAMLAQAKLPPLVALPVPRDAIALPDNWAATNATVTITLSQPPPGKLLIRRVSNNDGKLYLEIYSPAGPIPIPTQIQLAGQPLAIPAERQLPIENQESKIENSTSSLWLSLTPKIATLQITILPPAPAAPIHLTTPATLVEIRGRQIFLNGEPFLIKGVSGIPANAEVADYIQTLGINTVRGNVATGNGDQYGYKFMSLASLNSINAPKEIFGKPDAAFWKEAQPYIDKIPETSATTIANPRVLIIQMGNERSGEGHAPGIAPLETAPRHIAQMLVAARNAIKPLCPMLPIGYANQDLGFQTPDCYDVYMHNSFLDKDRYQFPWELFLKWQGCVPPCGPNGEGRPFVNSEFGANRYLPQSYHGGPNNPVLEKLHAWNISNRWAEFMQNGSVGGDIYNLSDNKDLHDQGCSRFGILTDDYKIKLACWEVARIWRDFTVDLRGEKLFITYKRDYYARDCRLTITPVNGAPIHLALEDFPPRSSRTIPMKGRANRPGEPSSSAAQPPLASPSALQPFSPSALSFHWRIDYTTHSGLLNAAAGACPAKLEQQDFLQRLRARDTAPFLTELFDAEVLTIDGKPAPPTLFEMTDLQGIIPVILRKPNGVAYLVCISRENIDPKHGPIKSGINLIITLGAPFKGKVEQVDDLTGQPLPGAPPVDATPLVADSGAAAPTVNCNPVSSASDSPPTVNSSDATPAPAGLLLKNIQAARIPGPIGKRSDTPFTMPVYRITPQN